MPTFVKRTQIPNRNNKIDFPGNIYDVTVFKRQDKLLIKASGVHNVQDYFEIKVTDPTQCRSLLEQFNGNLN